ncbi:UxaA family hydrolase [Alcaligenes sp. SDU_A2]|uniref:UxaA family hydrolase n=1 Tax=Alcaligenes sp. SDU_A2 TaxID=3136634 RepID=UPI002C718A5A|nr:UxaA family hydrolase [Alcaligenes sp.]HRL28423.1 UxaA family hydrolase [Alcaligenes sp.]
MNSGFLVLDEHDNVGVALQHLPAGARLLLEAGASGRESVLTLVQDIPMGHKFALTELADGAAILKYGAVIGAATAAIQAGGHVHIHNVESCRGRGDRA